MAKIILPQYINPPSWTLEEVFEVLSKIPDKDLIRILRKYLPEIPVHTLKEMHHPALLDLLFTTIDTLQKENTDSPISLLISTTSNICKMSFEAFVRMLWYEVPGAQTLAWNWHMSFLCSETQYVCEHIFKGVPKPHDIVCNISPGTSKSTVFTRLLPCWIWSRMPEAQIITASHTEPLVTDDASKSREVIRSDKYRILFPYVEFTESQDSKAHYRNTKGGERFTCTIGGKSPMGKHSHFSIVDDPIDAQKVMSEKERKIAADFLTQVLPTRRQRGLQGGLSVTMLVMQRLGVDDPTDVMLQVATRDGAAPVRHICLPAELTDDVMPKEVIKYYTGFNADLGADADGLMDPGRLGRKYLNEQRAILGEWAYAGQYLQRPRAPTGGMFKDYFFNNRVAAAPYNCKRIRYWDRAASKSSTACATAGVLMAYDGDRIYVEDCVYGRWEPDERNAVMRATALKDQARYGKYAPTIYVEAEGGSAGRDAWLGVVRSLIGFTVKEDIVRGSKDTRAEPWSTQLAAKNVWLVDNGQSEGHGEAGWDINGYIEEHLAFRPTPGGKLGRYKDRVDSSSGAFNKLIGTKRMFPVLQTFNLTNKTKNNGRWIVACNKEEHAQLEIERHPTITLFLFDPEVNSTEQKNLNTLQTTSEIVPIILEKGAGAVVTPKSQAINSKGVSRAFKSGEKTQLVVPESVNVDIQRKSHPGLNNNLATLTLHFSDLDPAEYQTKWNTPVEPWSKLPADLQFTKEHAKSIWSFIAREYTPPWEVLVVVDEGKNAITGGLDGRALSVSMAIADMLRLPKTAIYLPDGESANETDPPNSYVYDTVRTGRHLVV